ncbi:MAG: hypothetical protein HYV63_31110 [Candidatus Schekmanbacteria bacterium]|nr:hypothetical protein [Candidatus Schekmanbacteria bacterium]
MKPTTKASPRLRVDDTPCPAAARTLLDVTTPAPRLRNRERTPGHAPRLRLATAVVTAITLAAAVSARADEVITCDAHAYYYVLDAAVDSVPLVVYAADEAPLEELVRGYRSAEEHRAQYVVGICPDTAEAFEKASGVEDSEPLDGELWTLIDARGARLGTVWKDTEPPYALSDSISLQLYFTCPADPAGVLANVGAWHSGLDRRAINASETAVATYLSRVKERLAAITTGRMLDHGCIQLDGETFVAKHGDDFRIHYDLFDPFYGVAIKSR